jgi:hypothetical protein
MALVGCLVGTACAAKDDGSGSGSDDGNDGSGDDGGSDDGGGSDGLTPGPIDCAALPADGPTVAGGEVGPTGFPRGCSPRQQGEPAGAYTCCSDDPAASAGALPDYEGLGIGGGTPFFSGINNGIGTSGLCTKTGEIPAGSGLNEAAAANCPIPCNPTWADNEVTTVCGASRVCCQTQELQPSDCVQDFVTGQWRPVTGLDIGVGNSDGTVVTDWSPVAHATHQDPNASGCLLLANGDDQSSTFIDCMVQLRVANERGVCMALAAGQTCPLATPSYVDACAAMNL